MLLTNNYLIEQRISGCGDGGSINVFDKKGNQVFHVESSVAHYFSDSYEEGVDTIIAVINNVLYYISYNEEDFSNSSSGNLYFNSLDLSNLKLNKIQTFNAYLAGLA